MRVAGFSAEAVAGGAPRLDGGVPAASAQSVTNWQSDLYGLSAMIAALHFVGFTVVFTGSAAGRPAGPARPPGDVDPGVAPLRHGRRCAASAPRYSPNTVDPAARPVPRSAPRVRTGLYVGPCARYPSPHR